jgi:hypothetical protein
MLETPGKKHHGKRILTAQSEPEVTTAINEFGREFDVSWQPIGGQENNYGVVENQSSSPLGALNEILSNGIDAVLRRRYRGRHGDTYEKKHSLTSYKQAAEELLDGTEEVRLITDGDRGGPVNVTIYDSGEGQTYRDFEDTFVGLLKPGQGKQSWPFLQGQFGMGSTAVLPHCGTRGYKAIFSAGMEDPEHWTWTLIRRNRAGNAYEYLKLDGSLPAFSGTLEEDRPVGSFVKMFHYDLPVKSTITAGLRFKLARIMTSVPVPVVLDERRDYNATTMESNVVGFKQLISRHPGYVKHRIQRTYDFGGELGERNVELVVFKQDEAVEQDDELNLRTGKQRMFVSNRKQRDRAIFFTVNGQVHGDKGLSFIKNRCDKYHTGKDTVAFVDFSDLGPAQLTDLFTPARDRLQDKKMAKRLESGMEDLLTNDPMLVEEEQHRREQFTRDKRDEKMGDMLEELVDRNPELLEFLEEGDKVSSDQGGNDTDREEYQAPFYPDTLVPLDQNGQLWQKDERYEVEIPTNRNRYISFYMNAPNNFFTRSENAGVALIQPQDVVRSHGLSKGTWSIQLRPLEAATPGMTMPVEVQVGTEGMDPLSARFNINYVEPIEEEDEEKNAGGAEDDWDVSQLDFPPIYEIYEDDWDSCPDPFDEQTPVRIVGTGADIELYVNYDAAPVKDFLSRYNLRKTGKETVKESWKVGVAMYALSTYIEVDSEFDAERIDPDHISEVSMRGIVQSMLDQQISEDELEALTV